MNNFFRTALLSISSLLLVACGGSSSGGGNDTVETNTAPVAVSDTISTMQDITATINLQASDADGDSLSYSIQTQPQNGTVNLTNNVATYIPTVGYSGSDTFSFLANDSQIDSNTANIDITISEPVSTNTAPISTAAVITINQNTDTIITLQATDSDGDSLTYSISTQPLNGTVALNDNIATYMPTANYAGEDSFSFIANDSEADSNIATVDITVAATSSILGRITTADGTLVTGSTVNILDAAGTLINAIASSANGEFVVTERINTDLVLTFSKDGFANQIVPVKTPDGKSFESPLDVVMIERSAAKAISITSGGTLNGSDGSSVIITPNSFVDASGNVVSGSIDVFITPVNTSNKASLASFPGQFSGIVEGTGVESSIASLGTVEFVFTQNGEPLQLADGMTADILIPIYTDTNPATGNAIQVGDVIALWSLNENTGIWLQEGTGTVVADTNSPTGFALSATVSHFTWWNCDVTINPGSVTVTVDGAVGAGVAKLFARTDSNIGFRSPEVDTTITIGTTSSPLPIASGAESCFWVEYYIDGLVASTDEQCITVASNGDYNLTFTTFSSLPLQILHSQNSIYGLNITASPILLRAQSLESSVSYTYSGSLPNGMTLVSTGSTKAQIQGIPTESGTFSVIVEGTDSDNNTSTTAITFDVINLDPPMFSPTLILQNPNHGSATFDLTQYNTGGPATSWMITNSTSFISCCVNLSSSGTLTFTEFLAGQQIDITATNDAGSSSVIITIATGTM
jgi:hypothetical protein